MQLTFKITFRKIAILCVYMSVCVQGGGERCQSNVGKCSQLRNLSKGLYWFTRAAVTRYPKLGSFTNRNVLSHILETRNPRSRYQQGSFFLRVVREGCEPCLSPSFRWFSDNLCYSLAYLCITPMSAFMFTRLSLCLRIVLISHFDKDTNHTGLGTHAIPV